MRKLNNFLAISIVVCGLLFSFFLPPFFSPDEVTHWSWMSRFSTGVDPWRDGQCSEIEKTVHAFPFEVTLRRGSGTIPKTAILDVSRVTNEDCKKIYVSGIYAHPSMYFPAGILFYFNTPWWIKVYAGRLLNVLLLSILLFVLFQGLRKTDEPQVSHNHELALFWFLVFAHFPLSIQQWVGLTMDYSVYCSVVGFAGLYFWKKFNWPSLVLWSVLLLWGALSKPVLIPLCLILLLRFRVVGDARSKILFCAILSIAFITVFRGLLFVKSGMDYHQSELSVRTAQQKIFMMENPIQAFKILLLGGWGKILQYPSTLLGWLSVRMPWVEYLLAHVPFVFLGIVLNRKKVFEKIKNSQLTVGVSLIGVVLFVMLTGLGLYLGATQVGANSIAGLQSRYYFPILVVGGLVTLSELDVEIVPKIGSFAVVSSLVVQNMMVVYYVSKLFPG